MRRHIAYWTLLAGAGIWCSAIVAAPLLQSTVVHAWFSLICHQDPLRSWHLAGEPLAACIRCTSIYCAFFAALLLGVQANVRWLQAGIILSLVEFATAQLLWDSAVLRSLTGVMLGASAAPFVLIGVKEAIAPSSRRIRRGVARG